MHLSSFTNSGVMYVALLAFSCLRFVPVNTVALAQPSATKVLRSIPREYTGTCQLTSPGGISSGHTSLKFALLGAQRIAGTAGYTSDGYAATAPTSDLEYQLQGTFIPSNRRGRISSLKISLAFTDGTKVRGHLTYDGKTGTARFIGSGRYLIFSGPCSAVAVN